MTTEAAPAAILVDCEGLTAEGAMGRLWFGDGDPDPHVVQIGAVRLTLAPEPQIAETLRLYVRPSDRRGRAVTLDPYFTRLTGVGQGDLDREGLSLAEAYARLAAFAGDAPLWSWGKDEVYLMAVTGYGAGVAPPLPAHRFGNLRGLMRRAGRSEADMAATGSGGLAAHFGVAEGALNRHDALDDARSLAWAARHLLREGRLRPEDFAL